MLFNLSFTVFCTALKDFTMQCIVLFVLRMIKTRELHGDGDDGRTAVMGLDFATDTVVIVGTGTAVTVVPW